MARIKLRAPEPVIFETVIPIRIGDINYGGHLGNDAVLSIIHEARLQALSAKGFSEMDAGGPGLIMGDCAIVFKNEAFYGAALNVTIGVDDAKMSGFDFVYQLTDNKSEKIIALAKTAMVFFDYNARRVTKAPEPFQRAFYPANA